MLKEPSWCVGPFMWSTIHALEDAPPSSVCTTSMTPSTGSHLQDAPSFHNYLTPFGKIHFFTKLLSKSQLLFSFLTAMRVQWCSSQSATPATAASIITLETKSCMPGMTATRQFTKWRHASLTNLLQSNIGYWCLQLSWCCIVEHAYSSYLCMKNKNLIKIRMHNKQWEKITLIFFFLQ